MIKLKKRIALILSMVLFVNSAIVGINAADNELAESNRNIENQEIQNFNQTSDENSKQDQSYERNTAETLDKKQIEDINIVESNDETVSSQTIATMSNDDMVGADVVVNAVSDWISTGLQFVCRINLIMLKILLLAETIPLLRIWCVITCIFQPELWI